MMRAETYAKKYRELATWFLEHQTKIDFDEPEIVGLAEAIDVAIDNWIGEKRPSEAAFRKALTDAGRLSR